MANANRQLAQRLSSIAHSWVVDPFRPNMQLGTFLNSLAAHPRLTLRAVNAARSLHNNDMARKVYTIFQIRLPTDHNILSIHFRTKCYIPHRCPTIMTVLLRDLKRVLEEYDGRGGRFFSTSGNLVGMK